MLLGEIGGNAQSISPHPCPHKTLADDPTALSVWDAVVDDLMELYNKFEHDADHIARMTLADYSQAQQSLGGMLDSLVGLVAQGLLGFFSCCLS